MSRALTEYIIQMAEPFEAGGVLYVDRKAVDSCARRMFSSRKQERTAGDEQPTSGASTSKAALRKDLKSVRKELNDARRELERLRGQLEKEEKDALKGSSTSRTIADMGIRITTLEKCFDEKTRECEMLEEELRGRDARLAEAKEKARASEQQAKRLQEALDSAKDSASARNGSSALDSIPEYYSGEIWDFIGHLARQRLAVLPDEDASSYRRERDLCEMLSAAMPDSGVQRSLSADIEEAVRMKFDKNLNAGLLSLGFVLESSNSHEKFVLKGAGDAVSSRVSIIFSKTPSDRKARAAATAGLLRMLTFGGSGAKESQQAEGKEI